MLYLHQKNTRPDITMLCQAAATLEHYEQVYLSYQQSFSSIQALEWTLGKSRYTYTQFLKLLFHINQHTTNHLQEKLAPLKIAIIENLQSQDVSPFFFLVDNQLKSLYGCFLSQLCRKTFYAHINHPLLTKHIAHYREPNHFEELIIPFAYDQFKIYCLHIAIIRDLKQALSTMTETAPGYAFAQSAMEYHLNALGCTKHMLSFYEAKKLRQLLGIGPYRRIRSAKRRYTQ